MTLTYDDVFDRKHRGFSGVQTACCTGSHCSSATEDVIQGLDVPVKAGSTVVFDEQLLSEQRGCSSVLIA